MHLIARDEAADILGLHILSETWTSPLPTKAPNLSDQPRFVHLDPLKAPRS